MHIHSLEKWQHSHDFLEHQERAEKNTKIVMAFTAITMVVEVVAGGVLGSMALLADGWHMATHVAAFGITLFAYGYARKHANNPKFTFGTGKVSVLGGFTSAVALAVIALVMAVESVTRLFQPQTIQFNEAIGVAVLGLGVNLVSALLLRDHHGHKHQGNEHQGPAQEQHAHHLAHDHGHDPDRHPRDHNLQAAYLHVLADALTSVFAIVALLGGKLLGWVWLDAAMGLVGAAVIAKWAYGLVLETGVILLDGSSDTPIKLAIVTTIEEDADNRVTDLHVWYLSQKNLAATISLVTHSPQHPDHYKTLLRSIPGLSHVLVEVNPCHGEPCGPKAMA